MTAPDRIWAWTSGQAAGIFDTSFHGNVGSATEYIRADLAAVQPAQVRVKPLDIAYVQRHAFLSGVVAARNVPRHEPINGPALWLDYDPGDNPALSRLLAAIEPQPNPSYEVIKGLAEALELADASLAGANMNMKIVRRKVEAALAAAKAVQHD